MAVQYGGVSQETLHVAPLDYTAGEVARGGFHKNPWHEAPATWPQCYRPCDPLVVTRAMRWLAVIYLALLLPPGQVMLCVACRIHGHGAAGRAGDAPMYSASLIRRQLG